eukprot:tig00000970_g5823.t1
MTAAEVVAALRALYTSPDAGQRNNANLWLIQFQSTPAAWGVSLELLSSAEGLEAQHFAAQTLHSVITRQWDCVPPVEQAASALVPLLLRFASGPAIVQTKLCLSLAALTVRVIPQGWPSCFADIMRVAQGDQGQLASPLVGASLLQYFGLLPEEYEAMVCTQARRDAVKAELAKGAPALCSLCEAALRGEAAPEPAGLHFKRAALSCLQHWLPFLPPSFVVRGWPVEAALEGLRSAALCGPASELLVDALATLGDAAQAEAVCRVAAALVEACGEPLLRPTTPSAPAPPPPAAPPPLTARGAGVGVVNVLLQCTAHPARRVSYLTLEAWHHLERSLADAPAPAAAAYAPVYRALVETLVRSCAYPPEEGEGRRRRGRGGGAEASGEDLGTYRREAGDALAAAFRLLRGDYFEPLLAALSHGAGRPWQATEALLFAVQEAPPRARRAPRRGGRAGAEGAGQVADYVCDAAHALPEATHGRLEALFAAAAASAEPGEPLRLKRRRLALLGAYAEWVQGRPAVAPPPSPPSSPPSPSRP